ncbi:MAG: PDZ domain-containing protein [Planctomycetes bacterium]|nr:PDZ domain-containing protein [Planctomycetota bacterium]
MRHILFPLLRSATLAACVVGISHAEADGYVSGNTRPMLGVEMSPVPLNVQTANGISPEVGVYVRQVFPGTAAEHMGVQVGDVIPAINGTTISGMNSLRQEVGSSNTGDPIQVTVIRNGQRIVLDGELREWPVSIPYDRIDSEAERRFRDWQARRTARSQNDVQQFAKELAETKRALAERETNPGSGFTQSPTIQQALGLARWMPAWTMTYHWNTAGIAPAPGELAPAQPVGGDAWSLAVKLDGSKPKPSAPRIREL